MGSNRTSLDGRQHDMRSSGGCGGSPDLPVASSTCEKADRLSNYNGVLEFINALEVRWHFRRALRRVRIRIPVEESYPCFIVYVL